jgi:hypothetical protein
MRKFNFLFALILAVGLFLPFNYPVQADTEVETLDGVGIDTRPSINGWTVSYVGGADYTVLNSDDAGASYKQYVYTYLGSATYRESFDTTSFTSAYATINSVTATAKVYMYAQAGALNHRVYYRTATGTFDGSGVSVVDSVWTTVSHTWATCPSTGLAWTPSDIDNNEFGFYGVVKNGAGYYEKLSYLSVSVDYTPLTTPLVTTQAASAITSTAATGNGNITSNGGLIITEKGICYLVGNSGTPTTADSTVHDHVDSVGAFTESLIGLTKGTAYRLRAYGINALGTSYGVTVDLVTIGDPTISTIDASLVTSATARINASVTFDGAVGGGEPCIVTFCYFAGSPYADYAAILAAGGTEVIAAGTYTAGLSPYYDLSGLTIGTLYSFAVKIVNSTATTAYGSVLTFTTETGIADTSGFTAIPTSTTISLAWVKGLGLQYTLVRYSDSAYPAAVTDGVLGYLNTGNSVTLTGLTSGTTYYFSAWGKTSGLYSATPVNAIATTLAYDAAPTSTTSLVTPTPDSTWTQTPSSIKTGTIPLFGVAIDGVATAYNQPVNYVWYFAWILAAVGAAIVVYIKGNFNFVLSLSTMIGIIGIGVWWYNIVAGLIVVVLAVIGVGWALVGFRRPGT